MSLKQIIKERKILASGVANNEFAFPGEPMIYSVKYSLGMRRTPVCALRNKMLFSHLRCQMPAYMKRDIPVVLFVRFYVTPPSDVDVTKEQLKSEKIPAVASYELCDYLLSFLEMLRMTLFGSYRQIVHMEAQKFYSAEPRTVFKFMKWDHYVHINQVKNSDNTQAKSECKVSEPPLLQPKRKRNEKPS